VAPSSQCCSETPNPKPPNEHPNAAGAVTFSVLSGVLLNVLLPVRASNATVDAGPAGAGLKDNA
jgi:hypothetical protein